MATAAFQIKKDAGVQLARIMTQPMESSMEFFTRLGAVIQRDIDLTFRTEGARGGHAKWTDFARGVGVHMYAGAGGLFYHRPGTDKSKTRRYSFQSKLLQASGSFKKSFGRPAGVFLPSKKALQIGSNFSKNGVTAEDILSDPQREVIFITEADERNYINLFHAWYRRGLVQQPSRI